MYSWRNAYVDSGATVHMVMDDYVLSMNKKLSSSSIETGSGEFVDAKSKGTSEVQLRRETGLAKLDCVLHVPKIAHSLTCVAGLSED